MRNFSRLTLILAAFALCSAGNVRPASALIVEEGYEQTGGGVLDSIREYVFLNFGAFSTPTGDSQRHLIIGSGGIDFSADKFQVYVEGRAWKEKIELVQEGNPANPMYPPAGCNPSCERTLPIESEEVEMNEAYISVTPHPRFSVKAGRSKVVWGQFDIFSPVFFNLPFTTKNIGTTFSKVNYALAQNIAQVTVTPHERIELQGYFFLKTIVDPLVADVVREEYGIKRDDLQDHNQYAGRAIFYPDWGTIALTYLHGRSVFSVDQRQSISLRMGGMCPARSVEINNLDLGDGRPMDYCLNESPGLQKLDMFAVEATIPFGKWNIKSELSYRMTKGDVEQTDKDSIMAMGNESVREFLMRMRDSNGGQLYADVTELLGGIGIQYSADRWTVEAAGFTYSQMFEDGITEIGDSDPDETFFAPFFNGAFYLSEDKKSFIGLTAGFLGSIAFGGSLYGVWNIERFDSYGAGTLQLTAGLDVLQYRSDSEISDLNETEEDEMGRITRYEFDEDFSFAPRVGLVWKF